MTSEIGKALHIRLSLEQTRQLHEWAARRTAAEVEAGCKPSGFYLEVAVSGGYPSTIEAIAGGERLDLGDVEVVLVAGE